MREWTAPGWWVDVAVGAAFATAERAAHLAGSPGRRASACVLRGTAERERRLRQATELLDAATAAVATSRWANQAVDAQLTRLLPPVVDSVLDDVLALLEREPERVRSLVRGQRDTLAREAVGRIRAAAVAGDTAVDRLTGRLLRRGEAQPARG